MSLANLDESDGIPCGPKPEPDAWAKGQVDRKAHAKRERDRKRDLVLRRLPATAPEIRRRLIRDLGSEWTTGTQAVLEDLVCAELAHALDGVWHRGPALVTQSDRAPAPPRPAGVPDHADRVMSVADLRWRSGVELAGRARLRVPLADAVRMIDELADAGQLDRRGTLYRRAVADESVAVAPLGGDASGGSQPSGVVGFDSIDHGNAAPDASRVEHREVHDAPVDWAARGRALREARDARGLTAAQVAALAQEALPPGETPVSGGRVSQAERGSGRALIEFLERVFAGLPAPETAPLVSGLPTALEQTMRDTPREQAHLAESSADDRAGQDPSPRGSASGAEPTAREPEHAGANPAPAGIVPAARAPAVPEAPAPPGMAPGKERQESGSGAVSIDVLRRERAANARRPLPTLPSPAPPASSPGGSETSAEGRTGLEDVPSLGDVSPYAAEALRLAGVCGQLEFERAELLERIEDQGWDLAEYADDLALVDRILDAGGVLDDGWPRRVRLGVLLERLTAPLQRPAIRRCTAKASASSSPNWGRREPTWEGT